MQKTSGNRMKKLLLTIYLITSISFAQSTPNSLLKNFKPFETPRTNCRPGTVYRIDKEDVLYIVQDVKQIKSEESLDGTLIGQMTFSREELLTVLNLNFKSDFVTVEVEIKNVIREYTEQVNVDLVLWDNDVAEDILVDRKSDYYLIRETVASQNIIFRFSRSSITQLVSGKSRLKEKTGDGVDFPFELNKKFSDAKRVFFLEEEI